MQSLIWNLLSSTWKVQLFLTSQAFVQKIMKDIYQACKSAADEYNTTLQAGANIAGFLKVADAMEAQGVY